MWQLEKIVVKEKGVANVLSKMTSNQGGAISWMVFNRVTPNLLMIFLLIGGVFMTSKIKQEVFPEFILDRVAIRVSYPGSSPEEVEQGIVLAIEDAIEGIEGIKEKSYIKKL